MQDFCYYYFISKYNIPFDELFERIKILKQENKKLSSHEAANLAVEEWKQKMKIGY